MPGERSLVKGGVMDLDRSAMTPCQEDSWNSYAAEPYPSIVVNEGTTTTRKVILLYDGNFEACLRKTCCCPYAANASTCKRDTLAEVDRRPSRSVLLTNDNRCLGSGLLTHWTGYGRGCCGMIDIGNFTSEHQSMSIHPRSSRAPKSMVTSPGLAG